MERLQPLLLTMWTLTLPHSQAQRGGERAWFQPFVHVFNHGGIPPLPHTTDILSYTRNVYIDAKRCTLSVNLSQQHMVRKETNLIVLIQRLL